MTRYELELIKKAFEELEQHPAVNEIELEGRIMDSGYPFRVRLVRNAPYINGWWNGTEYPIITYAIPSSKTG